MSDIEYISKRVEADRTELAQALEALTETVKPQAVTEELSAVATSIGGAMTDKAWGILRDNPAGGLLVTLGLGLLASGPSERPETNAQSIAIDPDAAPAGFDARVAEADAATCAEMTGELRPQPEARKTKGFVHAEPLTAGALALGFGVLAATLLPGTRREDDLMGKRRDTLMADARNALEEEWRKAKAKT